MATLGYVGRDPDSNSTIVPKTYADSQQAALGLTSAVVTNQLNTALATLTTQSYVDTADGLLAHKASVDSADATYVAASALGTSVAKLNGSGNVIAGQIPSTGVITDRLSQFYSLSGSTPQFGGTSSSVTNASGTILLASNASHTVTTTQVREFKAATISIPDPGHPYRVLPFAWISGNASGGTNPGTRLSGNGNYGLITCMPPSGVSDQIYGLGICTASFVTDTYLMVPYAATSQTQISVPPTTGPLTLDLYLSVWSGSTYTYFGAELNYWIWVVPGV